MMAGDYAAMRGHNGAKRVSFAAMRVHHAAMLALIAATSTPNTATLREDPHHPGFSRPLPGGEIVTPTSPGIEIAWLPTPSPLRDCNSFFPCPVGTKEGSQVISIPGAIGVVVNHFRDTL